MAFVPPPPPRRSFFRGDVVNKMPYEADMREATAIEDHILKGWMPEAKFIGPSSNIVAFGSCFAANIGRYLNNLGFDIATQKEGKAYIQRISDGLVNVFAIAQQFEWAWENRVPEVHLWHGWKAEDYGYDEEVRLETKRLFDEADVFILTFGLSEIWYDEPTGEVFWRAVPEDKFDPARHKFRVATHAESVERLNRIYTLIRKHRPNAAIVFTLSPVGLAATFRSVSCISANSVSKAKLRSAIDEVHTAANDKNFFYFPSYEVVTEAFETPFNIDRRHPQIHAVETNMKAFEAYFCQTDFSKDDLRAYIATALSTDNVATRGEKAEAVELQRANRVRWVSENPGATSVDKVIKRRKTATVKEAAKATLLEKKAEKAKLRTQERAAQKAAAKAALSEEKLRELAEKAALTDSKVQARNARAAKLAEERELLAAKQAERDQRVAAKQAAATQKNAKRDQRAAKLAELEAKRQERAKAIEERKAAAALTEATVVEPAIEQPASDVATPAPVSTFVSKVAAAPAKDRKVARAKRVATRGEREKRKTEKAES